MLQFDVPNPNTFLLGQWWRVPLNQLLYISQSQVIISAMFFYNMRAIERIVGTRKYLSYFVLIYFWTLVTVPTVTILMSHLPILASVFYKMASAYIPPGSTSLVFAVLVLYKELIPPIYKFQITPVTSPVSITLSDKSFIYVLAADLLLLGLPGSILPALCGWILGSLIYFEVLPGKQWRVPMFLIGGKTRLRLPSRSQAESQDSTPATGSSHNSDAVADGGSSS